MPFYIQVMFIIIKTIIPKYFNAFFNKLLLLFKLTNNDISRYKIIVAAAEVALSRSTWVNKGVCKNE